MSTIEFELEKHVKHFKMCLNALPSPYSRGMVNHMSLVYFVVSGLDLLGRLDTVSIPKQDIINWIYTHQVQPNVNAPDEMYINCGFRGANFLGQPFNCSDCNFTPLACDFSSLANTYTSLALLRILGDDMSRVNRDAITRSIAAQQLPDGSFVGTPQAGESDMRHLFAACVSSFLMSDWRGVNKDAAVQYIHNSQTYEYGFAQVPGQEAHGGSTYCALASLALMGRLDELRNRDRLIQWLANKQLTGFCGRTNKDADTCYSFWVGGSLSILGELHNVIDKTLLSGFVLSAQHHVVGGIAKVPGNTPDLLHSYMSLSGLSLLGVGNLQPLNAALGISQRAAGQQWNDILNVGTDGQCNVHGGGC
ncbi:hypothetical protein SAMD00019534_009010, partial [Acytostelium subglobosum LB1]|uniref:hypothetical protein n=1 Tax=Acytostelium subglobosum LB1 TaxID=1410327 RepID=UPI000644CF3A